MSLESVGNIGFADTSRVAKVLAELQGLTIDGPLTGTTAMGYIAVNGIEPEDTILKVLTFGGSPDEIENVTPYASIIDRRAKGTLTVTGVEDGDVIVVNGKTYTFTEMADTICTSLPPYVVPIVSGPSGTDDEAVADSLAAVLMSCDSNLTCTTVSNVVTVIWRTPGIVGNSKTLVVSGSNSHVARSGATLANGSAFNGINIDFETTGLTVLLFWFNKQ